MHLILYIAGLISGILLIGWGMWATYNLKKPWDIIGAIVMPCGLILTLSCVLVICVPHFFSR